MNLVIFGNHSVNSAINSSLIKIKKLILREEYSKDINFLEKIKRKKIDYKILKKNDFLKCNFDRKNQGIVALINDYEYHSLDKMIKDNFKDEKRKIFVILDSIEDPHNFGAILRSCAFFKVNGILIGEKNQCQMNSTVMKVSVGGFAYTKIYRTNNIRKAINEIKKNRIKIVSTVCYNNKMEDEIIKKTEKIIEKETFCLILGNENKGIDKEIIKKSDYCIEIPRRGEISSLNVSVSCGIILSKIK